MQDAGQRMEVRKSEGAEAGMRAKLESRTVSAGGHDRDVTRTVDYPGQDGLLLNL